MEVSTGIAPRVTIIGAGNSGLTAAFHLSHNGCDVCLYGAPGFDKPLDEIKEHGGIESIAEIDGVALDYPGFAKIHTLTRDLSEAIAFSDILLLPVPSFAQMPLFEEMLPHLHDGQMLVYMPGNFGSLALRHRMHELNYNIDLTFVDTISSPWACRMMGPGEVAIMGLKKYMPLAALPASRNEEVAEILAPVLPLPIKLLSNVIEAGMENINYGGHPLLTTLSMGLLENFEGKFDYYKDCCSVATSRAAAVMEEERIAIGHSIGFSLMSELYAMNSLYGMNHSNVYDLNRQSETHVKIHSGPANAQHRYISEDVPYLLVPCKEFARLTGVKTPMIDACITIDNAYNQTDYLKVGRNLRVLGLDGLTLKEVMEKVA
ncbi:Opine dehydrogenase [invertebrate metagenome]|uniref:Opine dehydrogenase n=1 Tax=invertebrate metagenome TaxID=1711999 RepID=A0A2H9TC58_9ZZZZ